jgi:ribonuclease BN (tRNA processing enzyme)
MPTNADTAPVRIRVLGCSGAIGAGHRTTSFLLDEHVLLDCGTGVGDLTLEAMAQIDDVVLTHSHLDHILLLPLLAELVLSARLAPGGRGAVRVHGLPETLEVLRTHVFNGTIWPDFLRIPSPTHPILTFHPCAVGDVLTVGTGAQARRLWLLPAAHPVPACGIAIDTGEGWWVFTGDSGANPACWNLLASQRIAHIVADVSFPDEQAALAERAGHLIPRTLADALGQLPGAVPVHVSHLKPGDDERVMAQVLAITTPHRLARLTPGYLFELAATGAVAPVGR